MDNYLLIECIARLECVIKRGKIPLEELGHLSDIQQALEILANHRQSAPSCKTLAPGADLQ